MHLEQYLSDSVIYNPQLKLNVSLTEKHYTPGTGSWSLFDCLVLVVWNKTRLAQFHKIRQLWLFKTIWLASHGPYFYEWDEINETRMVKVCSSARACCIQKFDYFINYNLYIFRMLQQSKRENSWQNVALKHSAFMWTTLNNISLWELSALLWRNLSATISNLLLKMLGKLLTLTVNVLLVLVPMALVSI